MASDKARSKTGRIITLKDVLFARLPGPVNALRQRKPRNVTIAIMGPTGVGKTTFINRASGSDLRVGTGLESTTDCIQLSQPFLLGRFRITLVDTPGFDDTRKSDAEILTMLVDYLADDARNKHYLSGVIYMHRITDNRMGGIALRNFKMFMQLCGKQALPNAAIILNMWNEVSEDVRNARRLELLTNEKFFKPAIAARAVAFEHDNTEKSAHCILRHLARRKPKTLLIQREVVREHKHIGETAAGIALLGDLAEKERKHQEHLRQMKKEIEEAVERRDEEERAELEESRRQLEEVCEKLSRQRKSLLAGWSTRDPAGFWCFSARNMVVDRIPYQISW